jgi:hypothetical protein
MDMQSGVEQKRYNPGLDATNAFKEALNSSSSLSGRRDLRSTRRRSFLHPFLRQQRGKPSCDFMADSH